MHHAHQRPRIERKAGPALDRIECGLIELKFSAAEDPEQMQFEGHGAVFGNIDSYGDMIEKGAFRNTIREAKKTDDWPAMLLQHGAWQMTAEDLTPIGVWTEMEEDDNGLFLKGILAPTARGRDIYTLLKMKPRPAIKGLSIGYRAVKWKMSDKAGEPRRTLTEVALVEISPVTFPANAKAKVTSAKAAHGIRLAEQALRDAGFSAAEAKGIVARGYSQSPATDALRDAGGLGDIAALLQRNTSLLHTKP